MKPLPSNLAERLAYPLQITYPEELPVVGRREEIARTVHENQV